MNSYNILPWYLFSPWIDSFKFIRLLYYGQLNRTFVQMQKSKAHLRTIQPDAIPQRHFSFLSPQHTPNCSIHVIYKTWSSHSACLLSLLTKRFVVAAYSGYCLFCSSYGMFICLNVKLLALKYMISNPCYYFFLIVMSLKSCEADTLSWVSYIKAIQVLKFVLPFHILSKKTVLL